MSIGNVKVEKKSHNNIIVSDEIIFSINDKICVSVCIEIAQCLNDVVNFSLLFPF